MRCAFLRLFKPQNRFKPGLLVDFDELQLAIFEDQMDTPIQANLHGEPGFDRGQMLLFEYLKETVLKTNSVIVSQSALALEAEYGRKTGLFAGRPMAIARVPRGFGKLCVQLVEEPALQKFICRINRGYPFKDGTLWPGGPGTRRDCARLFLWPAGSSRR